MGPDILETEITLGLKHRGIEKAVPCHQGKLRVFQVLAQIDDVAHHGSGIITIGSIA